MKLDKSEWPYTPTLLDEDEIKEKQRELQMHWRLQKTRNGTCPISENVSSL
jgi:hypothetical protein